MSYRSDLAAEPHGFDFFAALRNLERTARRKPRIGNSAVTAEEVVNLGQDPFLEFPASNLSGYEENAAGIPRVQTRFLGFFGPQGALPVNTTLEAYQWSLARDNSFARFTDIFSNRFLQLFFRAWADARPIAQFDRPAEDRFFAYVGSFLGIGTPAMRRRDSVDDITKLGFAGLLAPQVKSAMRLKQLIRGAFKVDVDLEERVGSWLPFEPTDRSRMGEAGSTLGQDMYVGARAYTINEKIRIKLRAADLKQYRAFLPGGDLNEQLTDLVFFYLGFRYEFDVQLSLPARCAPPAKLGVSGELGLTAWMKPKADAAADDYLDDARFHPMERRRAARTGPAKRK